MATKKRLSRSAEQAPLLTPAQFLAMGPQPDGTIVRVAADATAGIIWRLRFNAGSANAAKWEVEGGSRLSAEVLTSQTVASSPGVGGFVDPATPGPQVVAPLAGDYDIAFTAVTQNTQATAVQYANVKLGTATTPPSDGRAAASNPSANGEASAAGFLPRRAVAAGAAIKLQYAVNTGSGASFYNREIWAMPVRVVGP